MRYNHQSRLGNRRDNVRETTAVTIGLALYWPMLRSPYFQNLFFTSSSTAFDGRETYAMANALMAVLGALALIVACRFSRVPARANHPSFPLLAGCGCAIGAALSLTYTQLAPPFVSAMQLSGISLFAIGFSAITVGWFSRMLSSCRKWGFVVAASFAASFASVGIEYLPGNAIQISLVAFPLATSVFLAIANRFTEQTERKRTPAARRASSPNTDGAVLAATCCCLIASVPSLCLFAPTRGYMPTAETPKTYIFSVLIAVAIAGIMKLRRPFLIKQGIILIILSALLIAGALALASTDNAMPFAATVHTCLQFALLLSLLSFWSERQHGGIGGAGAFLAITSLATISSRYLLPIAFPKGSSESLAAMLGMLSIVILAATGICLALFAILHLPPFKNHTPAEDIDKKLGERSPSESASETPPPILPTNSPVRAATQEGDAALRTWLESVFALSPRETDIALLVARGYTVNRIAEKLCLASGTVQSHMKSIYRKLDVHSKQEVIDLAQSRLSQ